MSVIFLSRHHGVANYVVVGGEFHGCPVSVRYLNRAWHLAARMRGEFSHLNDEQFRNHILSSIGIVHCAGKPVPAAIICEIDANLHYDRQGGQNVVPELFTGVQNVFGGFRRLSLVELDRLYPVSDDEAAGDELLETLAADAFSTALPSPALQR